MKLDLHLYLISIAILFDIFKEKEFYQNMKQNKILNASAQYILIENVLNVLELLFVDRNQQSLT